MNAHPATALIVVDVQNDFCEGGSLAVAGGAAVARAVSDHLAADPRRYTAVVGTLDSHIDPGGHFAAEPDFVDTWPAHCVAGTEGAEPHPDLDTGRIEAWFRKGAHDAAYSGFEGVDENGAGLATWLSERGVRAVEVVGIATDHCVRATALDAVREGFETTVLAELTAGVADATVQTALQELRAAGVEVVGQPRSA